MRRSGRAKDAGVALVTVMLVILILSVVMGAFFKAYQAHFALTRSSNASQAAGAACDAVFQYVVYRVEHDRGWGSTPFRSSGKGDPMGAALDFTEEPNSHNFSGRIESLDATFTGTIHNNLLDEYPADPPGVTERGTLLCTVTARSGDSTRQARFVLRVAPLFDSSVLTRADLKVHAQNLYLRSKDPHRNFLRAEGDIYVPDILNSADSRFLMPDSNAPDEKGMLWAKGQIHSYGLGGIDHETIDEPDEISAAVKNSHGKVVSEASSSFPIYDLEEQNLQLPKGNLDVDVKPGRWNFVRRKADVTFSADYTRRDALGGTHVEPTDNQGLVWVDVLEYYADPDAEAPTEVYRAAHRTDDLVDQVDPMITRGFVFPKTFKLDENSITTEKVSLPDYPGLEVTLLTHDRLSFENGPANVTFDLLNQKVTATHNATVTVDGPFHLTSETDDAAPGETPPPKLQLDYAADNDQEGGVAKAAIVARETLNIENGVTEGLGALISRNGDVRIQPKNTNQVTVDTSNTGSGLLIFAGGDVVLSNPDKTSSWHFKGLVYARDGIKMLGHGQDATFEGTLVALQENPPEGADPNGIEFVECGDIEFIYNSDLLDAYVKSLPGERVQLETVYWTR